MIACGTNVRGMRDGGVYMKQCFLRTRHAAGPFFRNTHGWLSRSCSLSSPFVSRGTEIARIQRKCWPGASRDPGSPPNRRTGQIPDASRCARVEAGSKTGDPRRNVYNWWRNSRDAFSLVASANLSSRKTVIERVSLVMIISYRKTH